MCNPWNKWPVDRPAGEPICQKRVARANQNCRRPLMISVSKRGPPTGTGGGFRNYRQRYAHQGPHSAAWRMLSPAASSTATMSSAISDSGGASGLARQYSGWRLRSQNMQAGVSGGYPTAVIGDDVHHAALRAGYQTIRTDGNALYPRSSRLMRWLESCAVWCCEGWKSGDPRFSKLASEGFRIFAESLSTESARTSFK